jgi:hypothetical protein
MTINDPAISEGIAGTGTIGDDDSPPSLTITDVQALEGDAGTTDFVFTVSLSAPSGKPITVAYASADGTSAHPATVADGDYTSKGGTLSFAADDTNLSQTVTVQVKTDTKDEFDETFNVNLSSPTNATIAKATGVGTIIDDDLAPSPLRWTGAADDHWENAANWYAGILPGPDTTVVFDGPVLHPPALYQDQEVRGLESLSAGWIIRGQGHTLTVGAGGINSAGTSAVEADVALGADSTWTLGNNSTLVLRGMLRGGGHTLTKDAAGTLVLAGGQDHTTGLALNVQAGTVQLAPAAGPLVLSSLSVAETGGAPTARLDIGTGSLIVDYDAGTASPLEDVKRWLAAGWAGMSWAGNGIASSAAALAPITHGLGYAQNNMLLTPFTSFAGQPADLSSVLVKYTYAGDLNLDGYVDGRVDDNDVAILGLYYDGGTADTHYWNEGDLFGYDGRIDDNDVSILGLTYGLGVGNPLGGGAAAVTLAAPTEPAAQPAVALAPSPVALRASASSPVAAVLPSETGLVDVARQEPLALAASDAAASSGAEALLAAAGASVGSSGAVGPVAALEVTAMAPPPAWESADRGERIPAADGGTLDLLSLPALAVLAGA